MKPLWAVAALSTALTALTPVAAIAATFSFTGSLSGTQEVPPNDSPATGSYQATLNGDPDNWSFNYDISFSDLTGDLVLAHIHLGNRGATGPVVHNLDSPPLGAKSGTITGNWLSTELAPGLAPATVFNRLLANGYYFNLHSDASDIFRRGGEIRGQIENSVAAAATVPEPASTIGLLLAGSAVLSWRRRQKIAN
jgi:CHRD domain/PEP-CTERM motif